MSSAPVAASLSALDAKQCAECQQFFNVITRRRRQCKVCLKPVCDSCSKHTLVINHQISNPSNKPSNVQEKVRACDGCYAQSLVQAASPVVDLTTPVSSNQASIVSSIISSDRSDSLSSNQADKLSVHQPDADRFLDINQIVNPPPFPAPNIIPPGSRLTVRTASHSNNQSSNLSSNQSEYHSANRSPSTEYFDQSPGGDAIARSVPNSSTHPNDRSREQSIERSLVNSLNQSLDDGSISLLDQPGWQSISPSREPPSLTINEAINQSRPSSFAAHVQTINHSIYKLDQSVHPPTNNQSIDQSVADIIRPVNQSISRSSTAITDTPQITQANNRYFNNSINQTINQTLSPSADDSNPQSPTSALTQILKHKSNQGRLSPQPNIQPNNLSVLTSPPVLQPLIMSPSSSFDQSNQSDSPSAVDALDDSFEQSSDQSFDQSINQSDDSVALKLDLPMKLCLVILKKTAAEMKERYAEYLRTKEARHDSDPLSFAQFMFFSIIRTLPEFVFKKTELAYLLMRDESNVVKRDAFVRYAPILQPIASKLDAGAVFDMLAQDTGGELGIALSTFKAYVDNMKRECHYATHQWQDVHDAFSLARTEQLVTMRTGVTDTSHFPPQVGRVGIASQHLLYESLIFRKRRRIKWTDIVRIERNEDGWMRRADAAGIKIHFWRDTVDDADKHVEDDQKESENSKRSNKSSRKSSVVTPDKPREGSVNSRVVASAVKKDSVDEKPPVKVILWDVPGIGHEAAQERLRFYLYLRMVHTSHMLSAHMHDREPLIAAALLQETFDLLRRMRALESLAPHIDPMKLNPYGDFSDIEQQRFVQRVRDIVKQNEKVKDSKKTWLTTILPGLAANGKEKGSVKGAKIEDIDPEFGTYKTFEEMNHASKEVEPFSVKTFSYNVKLFSRQLQPVIALYTIVKSLRNWDRPEFTVAVIMFLLNMCYRDFLSYIPAIIVLCNIVILIIYGWFPEEFNAWLEGKDAAEMTGVAGDEAAPVIISQVSDGEMNVASAITVVDRNKPKPEPSEPQGLLAKIRMYRDLAFKTKDSLQTVQNELGEINLKTMRVEGLYKWRTPQATWKFFGLLCVLFALLSFIPFRFILPFILADFFTDKWQKDGSMIDRLLMEAGLPDEMPDLS